MFKRSPTDTHFIVITLVLVALLGGRTFFSLVDEDKMEEGTIAASSLGTSNRAPASVQPAAPALAPLTQWDLSCKKKAKSALTVSGSYVQFQGRNCLKNFKSDKLEIVNNSNGYTASVFTSGTEEYKTDLIQLSPGENNITIRYIESSGRHYEENLKIQSSQI